MRKATITLTLTKYVDNMEEAETIAKNAAKLMDQLILTVTGETVTAEVEDNGEIEDEEEAPEEE